ncbi:MAG: YsnF/AvaK domain-containing protein [Polaromonas sp.]
MQTVAGVFDTVDDAERARESLMGMGFDESAVRVQSQSAMQGDDDAAATTTSSDNNEGFMASIGRFFSNLFGGEDEHAAHYSEAVRRGGSVVVVTVLDELQVEPARSALAAAGAIDIDKRAEDWRQGGYSGFDPAARPLRDEEIQADRSRYQVQTDKTLADRETVLPVVREELDVGKKEVDLGAVRVSSRTEVRPVQEQVQLQEKRAVIERRPVDRPATEADLKSFEGGGSIEVRETAERPVISKKAQVVEEVVVGTQATTRTETVTDEVRNTIVDIEHPGDGTSSTGQRVPDNQSNISSIGSNIEDQEPAYRYGLTLRSDSRYANCSWDEVEADAQREWTGRYPGSNWDTAKPGIKQGWDSMTDRRQA